MTQKEKKKSIRSNPEMSWRIELADKDAEIVATAVLHVFQKLRGRLNVLDIKVTKPN